MAVEVLNFAPNSAYVVAASTSNAQQALTQPPSALGTAGASIHPGSGNGYTDVIVYNAAAKVAYLSFGNAAQTASNASLYQVAPGAVMGFKLPGPMTNAGVILESGASAANVYIMLGSGS